MKKAFISDCEGPISKNDNAFEVTSHFVPNGDKLFTVISRYDDVLAAITNKPGYKAGDTLKLIIPFLKAYDLTDRKLQSFSGETLDLIRHVKRTLQHVRDKAHTFLVSTSYQHYVEALCRTVGFPFGNTYCTKVNLDNYQVAEDEKTKLREIAEEVSRMPIIKIASEAKSIGDLSEKHRDTIQRLDEIFWRELANMEVGKIFHDVNPVGGREKACAIEDAAERVGADLTDVMYVGDSITDIEAFTLVKNSDGLAMSFNGNRYAIRNAEIAVLAETSLVTAIIADVFCRFGKQEAINLVGAWDLEKLKRSSADRKLVQILLAQYPTQLPKAKIITKENMQSLADESGEFRKKVRGTAIGRLG